MELFLAYSEQTYGGEEINPSDSFPDHEPEYIDFYPLGIFLKKPEGKYEKIECDFRVKQGDTVYLLVIRHEVSGTFLTTHGCWIIEGLYKTSEKASSVEDAIMADDENWKKYRDAARIEFLTKKKPEPYERKYTGWASWEDLEDTEIHTFTVQ